MKKRSIVLLLALAGAGYLALRNKKQGEAAVETACGTSTITPTVAPAAAAEPAAQVVEEVLHKHEGEDNPVVHAFEEALEHKAAHAEAPA